MGNCSGTGTGLSKEEHAVNKMIEQSIMKDKKMFEKELKLLLLGAGESGKSTIARQMKLIYGTGFTDKERSVYRDVVVANVVQSVVLALAEANRQGAQLEDPDKAAAVLQKYQRLTGDSFGKEDAAMVLAVWKDSGLQQVVKANQEAPIPECVTYFMDKIDEIADPSYLPSDKDILYSRGKTTGVVETLFSVEGIPFRMVDVGGQRSERRKWIHCFEGVTSVIFFVSLSEYDQRLMEDKGVKRMHESMKLFEEICSCMWFKKKDIILFLNKRDIFAEKIKDISLSETFPNYTGGANYEEGVKYIQNEFQSIFNKTVDRDTKKELHVHVTCATDTKNVKFVFEAVFDILMKGQLDQMGIDF